jgi:hypothetical protein
VCAWFSPDASSFSSPNSVVFYAGGSGDPDCCASVPCASAAGSAQVAGQVSASTDLEVTVPDGTNAGTYTARPIAELRWSLTIAGVDYALFCGGSSGLVLQGPTSSTDATAITFGPFSATFPGHLFGATIDAVVTLA